MRQLSCFALLVLLLSCQSTSEQKEPFKSILNNCNEVTIVFYHGGDSLYYQTKDSAGLRIFKQLISGSTEGVKDTCSPIGELRYLADSTNLLTAPFSIPDSVARTPCNYVMYQYQAGQYKHALSDKAKKLLLEIRATQKDTVPPTR